MCQSELVRNNADQQRAERAEELFGQYPEISRSDCHGGAQGTLIDSND